jgi:hypothetical protein
LAGSRTQIKEKNTASSNKGWGRQNKSREKQQRKIFLTPLLFSSLSAPPLPSRAAEQEPPGDSVNE